MLDNLRIQLADWRDREAIQALRRLVPRPLDGGLYELLHWPLYHVHVGSLDGRPVGYTAIVLCGGQVADDVGTAVVPENRDHGVEEELRLTQLRDLGIMGYHTLYVATPTGSYGDRLLCSLEGDLMGLVEVAGLPTHGYYRLDVETTAQHLLDRGVRPPFPLGVKFIDRLRLRAQKAREDSRRLSALAQFNLRKSLLRESS